MFTVQPPSSVVYEGDRAVFTVRLLRPSAQPERVAVTVASGTATLGRDFMFNNSTQLLFAPGQTTNTFSVLTYGDSAREGVETFSVTASSLTQPNADAVTRVAKIFDLIPSTVRAEDTRIVEGNSGTSQAQFTVRLEGKPLTPVTVNYSTSDVTGTAGTDYTATSGVLIFAVGETFKTISVPVLGDTEAETNETFRLNFSNPSRGTTIATPFVTGTIANDETDQPGFQITIEYITSFFGEVPASVRTAMQTAASRWQQVITGDLPGFVETSTGRFVDDFRMRVQMGLLFDGTDGVGGALANAMPLQYRTGGVAQPWLGETGIDPSDSTNPQLVSILIHEIGHALGFASSNPSFVRWVSGTSWTGPNAVREYGILAGSTMTSVPLETGGGAGTAGAHWSESRFMTELMTGFVEPAGVTMPLSRLTIGAFADLGYTVSYAAADSYTLPAAMAAQAASTLNPPSAPAVSPPQSRPPVPLRRPVAATTSIERPASGASGSQSASQSPTASAARSWLSATTPSGTRPGANPIRAAAFAGLPSQ